MNNGCVIFRHLALNIEHIDQRFLNNFSNSFRFQTLDCSVFKWYHKGHIEMVRGLGHGPRVVSCPPLLPTNGVSGDVDPKGVLHPICVPMGHVAGKRRALPRTADERTRDYDDIASYTHKILL